MAILLVRLLFFCLYAPIILGSLGLFLSLENRPLVTIPYPIDAVEIKNVKTMFRQEHDSTQALKTLTFTQKNLNHMINYFLKRYLQLATHFVLLTDELHIQVALRLPKNDVGDYLNIRFKLTSHLKNQLSLHDVSIGRLHIADEWSQLLLRQLLESTPFKDIYHTAVKTLKKIDLKNQALIIDYQFESVSYNDFLVSLLTSNQQSLWFYQQGITQIIQQHNASERLSLGELLQSLFKIAEQRSTLENAIDENKRIIIVASRYVNGAEIQRYLPTDSMHYPTFLYQRTDIAKHFITSALLTVIGSGSLAAVLGQEKEFRDAKIGNGFSFIDLAADRAGIYFGTMLTKSPEIARRLQKKMAKSLSYHDFMPDPRDLPEKIPDKKFKERYGSTESPAYRLMLKEIDRRIIALPIYQNLTHKPAQHDS